MFDKSVETISGELKEDVFAMGTLVQQSKRVFPRYVYLELLRRRGQAQLRWRVSGSKGSTVVWEDVRFQQLLRSLPKVVQQQYVDWERQRLLLNERVKEACASLGKVLTTHELKGLLQA